VLGLAEMLNNLTSFLAIECNSSLLQQGNSANRRKNHTFSYRYQDITVCVSYPVMAQQSILEDLIASLRTYSKHPQNQLQHVSHRVNQMAPNFVKLHGCV